MKKKSSLDEKTELFKKEISFDLLNDEQKRIYNAFVFRRSKPYKFEVNDKYGNTIRFMLYTNKNNEGVLHIMLKHYHGSVGPVTSNEIVNLCDIIRNGEMTSNGKSITYSFTKRNHTYKLIVGLKKSNTDQNVLKSFYSNKNFQNSL